MDTNENLEQERPDVPIWLKLTFTLLGSFLILLGAIVIISYILKFGHNLIPSEIGANFIICLGAFMILVVHFPWNKLKFGGFEIERAIQEQAQDYSLDIEMLKKELDECKEILKQAEEGQDISDKVKIKIEGLKKSISDREEEKKLLIKLLSDWPTYGFTASRIITIAGERSDYEKLKSMKPYQIRMVVNELIKEGKIRIRISKKGNILYQIK